MNIQCEHKANRRAYHQVARQGIVIRPVSAASNSEVKQLCVALLAVIVGLLVLCSFLLMGGVFALVGPWVIFVGVVCITRRSR
jgi:hypothetical protein